MKMQSHEEIVSRATEIARDHARSLAIEGIVAPLRLYYKKNNLSLQSEGVSFDLAAEGWTATDRRLSPAIPYSQYWNWIYKNSRDLPIFV